MILTRLCHKMNYIKYKSINEVSFGAKCGQSVNVTLTAARVFCFTVGMLLLANPIWDCHEFEFETHN